MNDTAQPFYFDRRIPIALLVAVLMQTAAALVWAGAAGERIAQLEYQVQSVHVLTERTARMEARLESAQAALERIEAKIERVEERQ